MKTKLLRKIRKRFTVRYVVPGPKRITGPVSSLAIPQSSYFEVLDHAKKTVVKFDTSTGVTLHLAHRVCGPITTGHRHEIIFNRTQRTHYYAARDRKG